MADDKKSVKLSNTIPYFVRIFIAAAVVFFSWLKLADRSIYIFNTVFSCYTFAFFSAFTILLIYLLDCMKKNNGNFNFNSGFIIVVLCALLLCLINSGAEDIKNSKVKDVLPVGTVTEENLDVPSIVLCEVTEFNNMMNADSTYIDVYRVKGRIAKKLGVIDEVYFSVECIKDNMYTYFINEKNNTITIECSYGFFGDGIVEMNPAYETGKIQYVFKFD
ncbi:MAG: hypothetical protein K2J47_04855 [Ruminococcus sp.]|nr:hypothetical protein [Ruminococcus sp.]MDE6788634.1 hypothetical protein [Ruminococcus sp.]